MPILKFPALEETNEDGIIAVGGDLHPESLLLAYRQGIFPWPVEGMPLLWFCPKMRGVLNFDNLHISRSLSKELRRQKYRHTINQDFESVIRMCADVPRGGQQGTWITQDMIRAYVEFHRLGYAHSVELWDDEELVGGIYGVEVQGVFSAESMFHTRTNASKLALVHLIEYLRARGFTWIDVQVLNPHLESLGAKEIPRAEFLYRLLKLKSEMSS